ncbi:MAG: peptide deformylase [Candidatus Shikimatogenerans sp. JK-2022]|nr:peptide deformylase [Candidatus Shikimatogenerans bostrichidophilus]
MILPLLIYNKSNYVNKILRSKSKNIKYKINLLKLINNMFDTLDYYKGIGLSAPQIGLNIRLFIIKFNNFKKIYINPTIISKSKNKILNKEGCLSLPNHFVKVLRYKSLLVEYYNKYWQKKQKNITNLLSIVFQHEFDHLKGKLILDYI